ncbi:MAG: phasin family protein [Notoacmeibacter sp.]
MAKAAKIETPVDMNAVTDQFKAYAETAVEQGRDVFAKAKTQIEEVQKAAEVNFDKMQASGNEFGLKAISAVRQSTEMSLSHMESLFAVKSFAAFVELQTSFVRKQAELMVEQTKMVQDAAAKAASELKAA